MRLGHGNRGVEPRKNGRSLGVDDLDDGGLKGGDKVLRDRLRDVVDGNQANRVRALDENLHVVARVERHGRDRERRRRAGERELGRSRERHVDDREHLDVARLGWMRPVVGNDVIVELGVQREPRPSERQPRRRRATKRHGKSSEIRRVLERRERVLRRARVAAHRRSVGECIGRVGHKERDLLADVRRERRREHKVQAARGLRRGPRCGERKQHEQCRAKKALHK
eukprot:Amastigsp_a176941_22.p2 type:complete len:226 gc:universal Amastigsp_a176941_22:1064-1741(+)